MVLKGDSCLLNGRKPFFLPEGATEIGATECLILRVSRLGKGIASRFADRYYDATAPGVDFTDLAALREAQEAGRPWTQAIAFDYSLAIGECEDVRSDDVQSTQESLVLSPEEAIAEASRTMTIRQGDLIYIQRKQTPRLVQKEEVIRMEINGEEKLYCKIK
jgi:2-keto-4-pentenoate hydratase/2-oxohepta-3-ene-1,7-dioic acid hydratase in catechol pathway